MFKSLQMFTLFIFFFPAGGYPDTKNDTTSLLMTEKHEVTLDENNKIIPVWISSPGTYADSVTVSIAYIISEKGKTFNMNYSVIPEYQDIPPGKAGRLFRLTSDSLFYELEEGKYSAVILASSKNLGTIKENIILIIPPGISPVSAAETAVNYILNVLIPLLWNIFQIIIFLIVLGFLVRLILIFFRLLKGKNSLNFLPVVNETGDDKNNGIASGIDDLLMIKIKDINEFSRIKSDQNLFKTRTQVKTEVRETGTSERQFEGKMKEEIQIVKGDFHLDLQKIGDISIGIIKLPFGSLITLFAKIFGGNYLSGTLQKYGNKNKLILALEQKPALFTRNRKDKLKVTLFESTWPSEDYEEANLAEGIPDIIEEEAYRIFLSILNINTGHWKAYKHFLEGTVLYSRFKKDENRIDLLREAINCWRESLKYDNKYPDAHFNLAVALDRENNFEEAKCRYKKAAETGSDKIKADSYMGLAKLYWDFRKDSEKTLSCVSKAKKLNYNMAGLNNIEGLVYLSQGQYAGGVTAFTESIKNNSEPDPVYFYNLSVAQYYTGDYDNSEKNALKAYELHGENEKPSDLLQTLGVIYLAKGYALDKPNPAAASEEYRKAAAYFAEGLNAVPEMKLDLIDGYAKSLSQLRRYDDALLYFKRAVRVWPEYPQGYYGTANVFFSINTNPEFQACCNKAGKILSNPDNLKKLDGLFDELRASGNDSLMTKLLYMVIGSIYYYGMGSFQLAEEYLKRSVDLNTGSIFPFQAGLYLTYGLALMKISRYKEAADTFNKAIAEIDKNQAYDTARCYEYLGDAYAAYETDRNYMTEAYGNSIHYYRQEKMIKNVSDIFAKRGKWLDEKGYFADAEKDCNFAVEYNCTNFNAFHTKGNIYYDQYDYAGAIIQYDQAIEINFNLPGSHYSKGLCCFNTGNYKEAVKKFITAIKLDPFYEYAYEWLARSYEKLNMTDQVIKTRREMVYKFPNSAEYLLRFAKLLKKAGFIEKAIEELKVALNVDKDNYQNFKPDILAELANIYLSRGVDIKIAEDMILEAYSLYRKSTVKKNYQLSLIRSVAAWIKYLKGKPGRALAYYKIVLPEFINDIELHSRLEAVYEKYAGNAEQKNLKEDLLAKVKEERKIINEISSNGKEY